MASSLVMTRGGRLRCRARFVAKTRCHDDVLCDELLIVAAADDDFALSCQPRGAFDPRDAVFLESSRSPW